jgi:hypothetical protein
MYFILAIVRLVSATYYTCGKPHALSVRLLSQNAGVLAT